MSEPTQSLRKKWIEPVVAVLMALTSLCTAWCSYESAAWTRRSNRPMNESNAVERRAALLDVQGSQALIVHASMFMQLLGRSMPATKSSPAPFCRRTNASLCLRPNELSFRILQNQTHS